MNAVVIHDQMHVELRWHFLLQLVEKLYKFLAAMTRRTLTDDFAAENIKGCEQGGGAMALVVMGPSFGQAWAQRQQGRSAIQGLNLAFSSTHRPGRAPAD